MIGFRIWGPGVGGFYPLRQRLNNHEETLVSAKAANPVSLGVEELLGGSRVVTGRVISRVTILITVLRGLITPLITTHEPPSRGQAGDSNALRTQTRNRNLSAKVYYG